MTKPKVESSTKTNNFPEIEKGFYISPSEFNRDLATIGMPAWGVWMVLMEHTNYKRDKEYMSYPSYKTIQKDTGLSNKSISKALRNLVIAGWIGNITTGKNRVNEYHLNIKKTLPYKPEVLERLNHRLGTGRSILPDQVQDVVHSGTGRSTLQVQDVVERNYLKGTILTNQKVELNIKILLDKKIEDMENDLYRAKALNSSTDENKKMISSLEQSLREEKYSKEIVTLYDESHPEEFIKKHGLEKYLPSADL